MTALPGSPLTEADIQNILRPRWIDPVTAERAGLRRVCSIDGAALVGRNGSGDYGGIVCPYIWPGETMVRAYRLRRDHPEMEGAADGSLKAKAKYLSAPGDRSHLYFHADTRPEWLIDSSVPVLILEGELKVLSAWQLAWHNLPEEAQVPRFCPAGVAGVWNWRGVIGRTTDADGVPVPVKGPVPDLERITWQGRKVYIAFDSDFHENQSVQAARAMLARELRGRGARVGFLEWPADWGKGIDDALAARGPEAMLERFNAVRFEGPGAAPKAPTIRSVADIRPTREYAAQTISWVWEGIIVEGGITVLSGDSGCGKSTLITALADVLAKGGLLAGRIVTPRHTIILDRENPLPAITDRLARLNTQDDRDTFILWGGWCEDEAPEPDCPILLEWLQEFSPKPVIVVDSLRAFLDGDENDSAVVRPFFDRLRRLVNLGFTVIVIHHTGKADSARDYRGSSDIKAACDVGYVVANIGDPLRLERIELRAFKARLAVTGHFSLRFRDGEGFSADFGREVKTVPERLIELLRANPGTKTKEFARLAVDRGIGRNVAEKFLHTQEETGRVKVEKGEHNAQYYTWNGGEEAPTF